MNEQLAEEALMLSKENRDLVKQVIGLTQSRTDIIANKNLIIKQLEKKLLKAEKDNSQTRHQANVQFLELQEDSRVQELHVNLGLRSEESHKLQEMIDILEEERGCLQQRVNMLEERSSNLDRHRQWVDNATNYLGPMAQSAFRALKPLLDDLEKIGDAYHGVGYDYPWEEEA